MNSKIFVKVEQLFPACAGVILKANNTLKLKTSFPRMCGGDPLFLILIETSDGFSPHVRG